MKVLILHKWLIIGGVERVLVNLVDLLNSIGIDNDVFITYQTNDNISFQNEIKDIFYGLNSIEYETYKSSHLKKKNNLFEKIKYNYIKEKNNLIYSYKLINILMNNNYDLIIDFSGCLDKIIRNPFLSKILPHSIRWVHGQLNGENSLNQRQKKKYHRIFSKHNKVISICNQMNDILRNLFPDFPKEKFHTLYNPIDLDDIINKSNNELDESLDTPYILQVSRLVKGKGHEELIDIYSELKKKGVKHKLYFIGEGENRYNLEKKISELKLENDCFLLGNKENPYPYFKNASLFLHTSEHEGLPTVLLESMALGIPVISMDCPTGPKEILGQHSEYGKLIPLHDKTQFINAVLELLNDPKLYQHYQQQSYQRSLDFSADKTKQAIQQLFASITQKN